MNKTEIGISGADLEFYNQGHKSTVEIPDYVNKLGLDCFEYSFGKGIRLSSETRKNINRAFKNGKVEISVHAPYFINFANPDEEKIQNTFGYLYDSCVAINDLGGQRVVFHPGSFLKNDAETAFNLTYRNFNRFVEKYGDYLSENDVFVCPETMGKSSQVGTVEEIGKLCGLHSNLIPCVDFGHVNARYRGILKTYDDYRKLVDTLSKYVSDFQLKNMHIHFSKIEYGAKGEIKHLTFADEKYGPEFEPLAKLLVDYRLTPYIVSESDGTQGIDAVYMKTVYNRYK